MTDITPETVAVAYKYRWKIDGEYVQWRYSDASNFHRLLDGFEEVPFYSMDALSARLAADAKAHEKEIAVWSENYAALERRLAEVEAAYEKMVLEYLV